MEMMENVVVCAESVARSWRMMVVEAAAALSTHLRRCIGAVLFAAKRGRLPLVIIIDMIMIAFPLMMI